MQVSFEHKEVSRGLFKKKIHIEVLATIKFSDEELATINNRKLKDFTVWDRKPDFVDSDSIPQSELDKIVEAGRYRLTIGKLMKGKLDGYTCASPVHAKNYEQELTSKLKELKEFIVGSVAIPKSKTIEL